jgi:hypothetical protein
VLGIRVLEGGSDFGMGATQEPRIPAGRMRLVVGIGCKEDRPADDQCGSEPMPAGVFRLFDGFTKPVLATPSWLGSPSRT